MLHGQLYKHKVFGEYTRRVFFHSGYQAKPCNPSDQRWGDKRLKTCLALSCSAETPAVTPNTKQFSVQWDWTSLSCFSQPKCLSWPCLTSDICWFSATSGLFLCRFKGNHNFAFQGDSVLGKLHRMRRGPWGIKTWQIKTIHNTGLYDLVLQMKKDLPSYKANWFKSLITQCDTMTMHMGFFFGGGGSVSTKTCICGEKLSCAPQ